MSIIEDMPDDDLYYLVADETSTTPSETNKFFIYGGLALSTGQLIDVAARVAAIRAKYGFSVTDRFKWDTNSKPASVTQENHASAKNDVIEACYDVGARFIVQMTHHRVGSQERNTDYALNTLLRIFNGSFLSAHNTYGAVIIDRLPSDQAFAMMKEKFQFGLKYGQQTVPLDRIVMYATTCDGASHLSSAVDIVLGAFRWVVSRQDRPSTTRTEATIFPKVARMMYSVKSGDKRVIREYGLALRPMTCRVPQYQQECDEVVEYLQSLLK